MAEVELAMLKHANGDPVIRSAASASAVKFKVALIAAGGKAPRGMVWSERLQWHRPPSSGGPGGMLLADAQRRQEDVTRRIHEEDKAPVMTPVARNMLARRQALKERERAAARKHEQLGIDLYVRASDAALEFWKRYNLGFAGNPHPSVAECTGALLSVHFPYGIVPLEAKLAREDRRTR